MIIECINCDKKFEVNSDLIPNEGRTIQCGSCNHIWFFDKNIEIKPKVIQAKTNVVENNLKKNEKIHNNLINQKEDTNKTINIKEDPPTQRKKQKSSFSFSKFLSYILILIITFIALIIVLDTFKRFFFKIFPNLELILFSLFETLQDMHLFIKDLI
tara:strand:+ start:113 stop:583 length:471 start_codon:yes stop_codon:yes gene_type:complete